MSTNYKKYILSTGNHYISNSGSDENKQYHGGAAGDQTGKEWGLRSWYPRPWTCVIRWPDITVGTLLAQLAIDAALNDKIGYDQYQRNTLYKEAEKKAKAQEEAKKQEAAAAAARSKSICLNLCIWIIV